MASKTHVTLVDDLDGGTATDTISFSFDGMICLADFGQWIDGLSGR